MIDLNALADLGLLAYLLIFAIPWTQHLFMLDPSNLALTTTALGIGLIGAVLIEVVWWVQGAVLGERRRLWR